MPKNQLSRHRENSMFESLFDPLFKILGKVIRLRKFPQQLRSALIALIIVTMIVVVMYSATIMGVVLIWHVTH